MYYYEPSQTVETQKSVEGGDIEETNQKIDEEQSYSDDSFQETEEFYRFISTDE